MTNVGKAFAEKYTGFTNSVSTQLSLVEVSLQRDTVATLLKMGMKLKTALDKYANHVTVNVLHVRLDALYSIQTSSQKGQ